MRVHLHKKAIVALGYESIARDSWARDGLVPNVVRSCDSLMVTTKNAGSLSRHHGDVTCKHCLKLTNK